MHADTSDFFIEDCRPGGSTGWQYRRGDRWFDFQRREEVIRRKGDEPIVMHVYENEQGILSRTPDESEGRGKYLSVAWIGEHAEGGRAISTWLDVIGAPSAAAAMEAVRVGPHPSLVWLFADGEGHIGLQASGWLPVRGAGNSGIVPVAAWDPENHWQGRVRVDLLPREYDPAIGFVASANEELYRRDGPPLHAHAQPDYRKRRIVERLTELPKATVVDMQNLQYDVLSVQARDLLPVLLALVDDCPLKEKLSAWDCRYTPTSTEADAVSAFLPPRGAADFRQRARHRLAANVLSVHANGLFHDGAYGDRPNAPQGDIVVVAWPQQKDARATSGRISPTRSSGALVGVQHVSLRESLFRQRPWRPIAGLPLAADRHARLPCDAVSRPPDDDGHSRNDVRPHVSLCHRHGYRRGLDQFTGRT